MTSEQEIMQIGFSKSRKIGSRIIRSITRSETSHCFLYEPSCGLVYHASGSKVHAISFSNFMEHNEIVWLSDAKQVDWIWLREQLGKKYGFLTLVGFGISLLLRCKNPFKDGEYSLICSELVSRALSIEGAEDKRPDQLLKYLRDGLPL